MQKVLGWTSGPCSAVADVEAWVDSGFAGCNRSLVAYSAPPGLAPEVVFAAPLLGLLFVDERPCGFGRIGVLRVLRSSPISL